MVLQKRSEDFVQEAYLGIRRMLFFNEISPGQKIAYGDLAKRLRMSTTPVIQALKRLDVQGLVRYEPNRGYFTEEISLTEIKEIYDFREVIEVTLLPLTLKKLDPVKLKILRESLEHHRQAVDSADLTERLLTDRDFHLQLAELSGSSIQLNTLKTLFDLLYLKYRGAVLFHSPIDGALDEHQALFDCIAAGDEAAATQVLHDHIGRVREHAVACIREREKGMKLCNL